jgi:hypothetical protein
MRAERKFSGENWGLDGDTITVRIPMARKRRGGRKVISAPDGTDAWAPAKPRPDTTLIRALARAEVGVSFSSLSRGRSSRFLARLA